MHSYDIAGYVYRADLYCDTCIADIAADHARPDDVVVPILLNTQTLLREWAEREGVDQYDEATYDSDDFPKVAFVDQLDEDDSCGACHCNLLEEA